MEFCPWFARKANLLDLSGRRLRESQTQPFRSVWDFVQKAKRILHPHFYGCFDKSLIHANISAPQGMASNISLKLK